MAFIAQAFTHANATDVFATDDPKEGEAFTAARRFAIPAVERLGDLLLEDVGVPLPALPALVEGIEAIATERDIVCAVIAHAGDGNTHPLIVHDPTDPDQSRRAHLAFGEIMHLAIELGGTITGEHGVGRLKKAWLPDQVGPDVMELTRRIKGALDPQHILNPGAVL
jgi:glycolate oxidase